jgi:hypothetical protein
MSEDRSVMSNSHRSRRRRTLVPVTVVVALLVAAGVVARVQGWPPFGASAGAVEASPAGSGTTSDPSDPSASGAPSSPSDPADPSASAPSAPRSGGTSRLAVTPRSRPVLVAAVGDIACSPSSSAFNGGRGRGSECRHQAVADLIASRQPAAFLALGDIQYDNGTLAAFRGSYDKAFGRLLPITHPVVGNHEYRTPGAAGYWDYFGSRAGPRGKGWYSFDIGAWHVVALNANCDVVSCAAGSEQERWLRADLAAHKARCTLAMWHQPRWSSGSEHGDSKQALALVQALYDHRVDVLLSGHDHDYERFAPQDPAGGLDRARGVRQFVVGGGGKNLRTMTGEKNTEAKDASTFGALFLSLSPNEYSWTYTATYGGSYSDTGTTACH